MFYYSYPKIHGLPSAMIPTLVSLRYGLRDALLFEATQSEIEQISSQVNKMGLYLGIGGRHRWERNRIFIYVAKKPFVVKQCARSERRDPETLGKIFGYPECCISAFIHRLQQHKIDNNCGEPNFPFWAFHNTKGYPWPELNNLLWYINGRRTPYFLISHFPCSYRCKESLEYAQALSRLISTNYPRLARRINAYLSLPILLFDCHKNGVWDENHGYIFSGRSEGASITYSDVYPLRIRREIRPFKQGNRLLNLNDKINIFSNGKLLTSINKNTQLEAIILAFDR